MKIRPAEIDDAPAVWEAHVSAIRILCCGSYTPEQIEGWAGPRKPDDYLDPISNRRMFVAEVEGRVVGFAEFLREEVRAVYVHPDFARKGIGRALFQRIVEEMRARNVEKAWLNASLTSVPFYSAMGCKEGKEQKHRLSSGVEISCLAMEIEIQKRPTSRSSQLGPSAPELWTQQERINPTNFSTGL